MSKRVAMVVTATVVMTAGASSAFAQVTARPVQVDDIEDNSVPFTFVCDENGVMNGCDTATFTIINTAEVSNHGTVTGSGESRTFVPKPNYHFGTNASARSEALVIDYRINNIPNGNSSSTVTLTLAPAPDQPTVSTPQQATNEDTAKVISLVAYDPDADNSVSPGFAESLTFQNDSLTYTQGNQPQNGTIVWDFPNPVYTPNPNYSGTDSFTYMVSDTQQNSTMETVNIVVNPVNDPPEGVSETITISEDEATNITLKSMDPDGQDQSQFSYTVTQQPMNGSLTGQSPSFTYTPDADYTGMDTIKFTVSDGIETSAEATITLNIGQADDPPVWGAGTPDDGVTLSVDEGETLEFTALATDPDGDTITYALTGVANLNGASFDTTTGVFSWSPNYEDIDVYDLTLKATDPFNPQGIERKIKVEVVLVDDDNDNLPKTFEESINLDPTKADTDGDTIPDNLEVGDIANPSNVDGDAEIDALDQDSDNDGLRDSDEAGDRDLSTAPNDADADGVPDFRETDSDGDGTEDGDDNCPAKRNSGQENLDGDAFGDVCDDDRDGDGVLDSSDLCATEPSATPNGCPESQRSPASEDDEGCTAAGVGAPSAPGAPMMLFVAMLAMVGLVRKRKG